MRRRIREWNESPYRFIKSKEVRDDDGFVTDYTWWYDERDGVHFFVFGDSDIYRPNRDYADWECNSYEEAEEWFWNYGTEEIIDDALQGRIKEGWLDAPDALKKCKPNEVLDALQYFYGEDVAKDLKDIEKYTDEEKLKALKYYFKKHPQNESIRGNIKEDFGAQVDWARLKYELWDVLKKKLGYAYLDFGEVRSVSSNQSGVRYYVIWGDEAAGEEITTIAGKMFGTPSKITMTMHYSGQSDTDEVDVYNVDKMARALLNFLHQRR